jgi:DNA-binding NtrC family response regulator
MRQILAVLPNLAHSNTTVLLQGGAGTGKEVIATAIHNTGCRREQPLVKVSCGILPERLLNRELFGDPDDPSTSGRIEQSRGGTLFLHDVAALPAALQARLLAVLQGLEAEHGHVPPGVDIRVIAATKHDLKALVREGRFLEELYYRLNVVYLLIPELRERPEDLPHLVDHFIERLSNRLGRNVHGITDGALAALRRYPFPGNVRELVNAIEHAFTVAAGGRICTDDLPGYIVSAGKTGAIGGETERERLVSCLERNLWSVPRAARELAVHRTTLWRKMKRLNIEKP